MACHCHNNFLLEMKSYYLDISYSKVPWALSRAASPCRIPPRQNIYSFLSLSPSSCKVHNNNIYLFTYNYIQLYLAEAEYILFLILQSKEKYISYYVLYYISRFPCCVLSYFSLVFVMEHN